MIRDIIMFVCAPIGMFCIGYVRVTYSTRIQKHPTEDLTYTEKEVKIRKLGIALLIIAVILALIPAKYAF